MREFFFDKGLKNLARKLKGDEKICIAIRPYGFHAGNQIPLVIYPFFLCEELRKNKKEPKFTIYLVFNDWEQLKLDGPNIKEYPFNVYPKDTTLQYTQDPSHTYKNIVDYWIPIITKDVKIIKKEFPLVQVKPILYSEFKNDKRLSVVLVKTLKEPETFFNILKKYTNKNLLPSPWKYIIAVCPKCKVTKGTTTLNKGNKVKHFCNSCFKTSQGRLLDFDYWLYHTPLSLPRYQILDIDLCITGADKIDESDYIVREKLAEAYEINLKMPDVLYAPLVVDRKGHRMGKSRGNHKYVEANTLRKLILINRNKKIICID